MSAERLETAVTVAGGGMAGLVASLSCLRRGSEAVLLEKGSALGGSMALSGGNIWTYESMWDVRRNVRGGNRMLQRQVVGGLADGLEWLEERGVRLRPYDPFQGTGLRCDPEQLTAALHEGIVRAGGEVKRSTELTGLRRSRRDDRLSVSATDRRTGDRIEVDTGAVILATGGFQGDETLVRRHLAGEGTRYLHRANPWSDGAGLRAATSIGGGTTAGRNAFYGHNVVGPPATVTEEAFTEATQYYGPLSVALNVEGERFVDESATPGEERIAQATLRRAEGRAVYVIDGRRHAETYLRPIETMVQAARELGGNVAEVSDLTALRAPLDRWGFDGAAAVRTLVAFNEAMEAGQADSLDPPRANHRTPVDTPPFHAVEVQPGITFTCGGVRVDERMRVLGGDDLSRPIGGVWAAGVDVGGIHLGEYMGGLATALVTGRIAGEDAAASV